jgi:hypothetical protein
MAWVSTVPSGDWNDGYARDAELGTLLGPEGTGNRFFFPGREAAAADAVAVLLVPPVS